MLWDESAWEDYVWWQTQDRKVLRRINTLIQDVQRNGNEGIGKPEPLKHGFHGYWSRRITDEHRLIYKVADEEVRLLGAALFLRRRRRLVASTAPFGRLTLHAAKRPTPDASITPGLPICRRLPPDPA
ncbi:Txe/YoeB family addiction module toxin [Actinocrinis puniceicyclus]|uniref:Endoribonuclease YoeB n=1 Tax=Actinocrinis puniceicyclus TaxID=977794 RepID=A0A8J7WR65_9ACTN|nr:Txe/YoeB family addiction module toxin [Actinocrinis puniceicyclus]